MKELAAQLQPGHSALFVLFRNATVDKALDELRGTGGTVLKTSLSHEDEAKLREFWPAGNSRHGKAPGHAGADMPTSPVKSERAPSGAFCA